MPRQNERSNGPWERVLTFSAHGLVWSVLTINPAGFDRYQLLHLAVQGLLVLAGLTAAVSLRAIRWSRSHTYLTGFLVVLAVSAFAAASTRTAILGSATRHMGVASWLLLAGAFGVGHAYASVSSRSGIVKSVVACGAALGLWAVVEAATSGFEVRPVASLGVSASLGALLALSVVLSLGGLISGDIVARWVMMPLSLSCLAGLVVSGARAAWLGAAVGCAIVFRAAWPRADRRYLLRLGVGTVAVAVLAVVAIPGTTDRVGSLAHPTEGTAGGRFELMQLGLEAFIEHPLLGWGPDHGRAGLHPQIPDGFEAEYSDRTVEDRAHNVIVDVALWAGAPGAVLFVLFVTVSLRACWRRRSEWGALAIAGALLAYLVHLLFNFPVADVDVSAWLLLGVLVPGGARRAGAPPTVALVGAAIVLAVVAPHLVDQFRADRLVELGAQAEQRGEVETARRHFDAAAGLAADSLAWEVLARFELRAGDPSAAVVAAKKAAKLDSADPYLAELVVAAEAAAALTAGDRALAENVVAEAQALVEASPFDGSQHLVLGEALVAAGRLVEARGAFLRATGLIPDRPEPWRNLAILEERAGDLAAARTHYARALVLDPDDSVASAGLARLGT